MSSRAAWRLESLGFAQVYRYAAGKVDWAANGLPIEGQLASVPRIGSFAHPHVPTCAPSDRLGDVLERLRTQAADLCVVINDQRIVLGVLRGDALEASPETPAEDAMDPAPSTYRPNVSVGEMADHLQQTGAKRVLLTTADGELLGLLQREDVDDGPVLAPAQAGGGTHARSKR
jgi:CBS domain-containing protein